jgi:hypothetical protein
MTYFPTLDRAKSVAEDNTDDAWDDHDDWSYVVQKRGKHYVIAVCDEDGEFLGYL